MKFKYNVRYLPKKQKEIDEILIVFKSLKQGHISKNKDDHFHIWSFKNTRLICQNNGIFQNKQLENSFFECCSLENFLLLAQLTRKGKEDNVNIKEQSLYDKVKVGDFVYSKSTKKKYEVYSKEKINNTERITIRNKDNNFIPRIQKEGFNALYTLKKEECQSDRNKVTVGSHWISADSTIVVKVICLEEKEYVKFEETDGNKDKMLKENFIVFFNRAPALDNQTLFDKVKKGDVVLSEKTEKTYKVMNKSQASVYLHNVSISGTTGFTVSKKLFNQNFKILKNGKNNQTTDVETASDESRRQTNSRIITEPCSIKGKVQFRDDSFKEQIRAFQTRKPTFNFKDGDKCEGRAFI